ncbi:unnamed protein product [Caenorhabditis angaria]|uniref:Uncharacterized protein n=1 Tax=Caenorhabditis angaria TaxID=860376 RepID=A0A9P1IY91_9PELO|nr:unnamed protein product [Caenorhabditis angaria]
MFWIFITLISFLRAEVDFGREAEKVLYEFQKSIHEKNQLLFIKTLSSTFEIEQCDLSKKNNLKRADIFNELIRYNIDSIPISKIDFRRESVVFEEGILKITAKLEQGGAIFHARNESHHFVLIKERQYDCNGIIAGTMVIDSKKLTDDLARHLLSGYVDSIRSKDSESLYKIIQKSSYKLFWCNYEDGTYHNSQVEVDELENFPDELISADIEKRIDVKVKSKILEDKTIVIDVESECNKINSTFEAKYSSVEKGYQFVKETNHRCFTKPPGLQYENFQNASL